MIYLLDSNACITFLRSRPSPVLHKIQQTRAHDLQIAAIALAHDLTLITHNVREFGRISGLRKEDWQSDASSTTP